MNVDILTLIILLIVYFLPAIFAYSRNRYKADGVLAVNFLLGWTVIGWMAALIMSCCIEPKNEYLARMNQLGIKK